MTPPSSPSAIPRRCATPSRTPYRSSNSVWSACSSGANLATAEGRARAAEVALRVLAEHPSELVRDQYLMQVADRLRPGARRPCDRRWVELARSPVRREIPNEPPSDEGRPRTRSFSGPMPRPGLEALRLYMHAPRIADDRFIAQYFVNETQREIFEGLATGAPVSDVIDALGRRGEEEAANVLSQLVVDELDRDFSTDDVTAVVSQLLRSAVSVELKNVERELRSGALSPELTMATIKDVQGAPRICLRPRTATSPKATFAAGCCRAVDVDPS